MVNTAYHRLCFNFTGMIYGSGETLGTFPALKRWIFTLAADFSGYQARVGYKCT